MKPGTQRATVTGSPFCVVLKTMRSRPGSLAPEPGPQGSGKKRPSLSWAAQFGDRSPRRLRTRAQPGVRARFAHWVVCPESLDSGRSGAPLSPLALLPPAVTARRPFPMALPIPDPALLRCQLAGHRSWRSKERTLSCIKRKCQFLARPLP